MSLVALNYDNIAYEMINKKIQQNFNKKQYFEYLISVFNHNVILNRLKVFSPDTKTYQSKPQIDLEEKYDGFPPNIRTAIKPIYEILNFSAINQYYATISTAREKKEKQKKSIESGGFSFDNEACRYSIEHINFLKFVLGNCILLETDAAFRKINLEFIKIAIDRQVEKRPSTMNRYEIFAAIKYLNENELNEILTPFRDHKSKRKATFQLTEENINWLISQVLPNLLNRKSKRNIFDQSESYIVNAITILHVSKLSNEQADKLLLLLRNYIIKAHPNNDFYKVLNRYMFIPYYLHKTTFSENIVRELLNTIINKYIHKNNVYMDMVITGNQIPNLFNYCSENKIKFENKKLLLNFLKFIKQKEISEQISISAYFLTALWVIADDDVKKSIITYFNKLNLVDCENTEKCCMFNLIRLRYKIITIDDFDFEYLNGHLDHELSSNSHSIRFNNFDDIIRQQANEYDEKYFEKTIKLLDLLKQKEEKIKISSII